MSSIGSRTDQPRLAATLVMVGGLVATPVLIVALFINYIGVYFVIEGSPVVATEAVARYDVFAGLATVLAIAAVIAGVSSKRWGFVAVQAVLLVVALVAVIVLSVPQGVWFSPPPPDHSYLPPGYQPCYSGSNVCGPGG